MRTSPVGGVIAAGRLNSATLGFSEGYAETQALQSAANVIAETMGVENISARMKKEERRVKIGMKCPWRGCGARLFMIRRAKCFDESKIDTVALRWRPRHRAQGTACMSFEQPAPHES